MIIAVQHPGGGVGKTTTALNLAWSLRRLHHGSSVALADLDPQADLSRRLRLAPVAPTLASVMIAGQGTPGVVPCRWTVDGETLGFDMIPGNLATMAGLDLTLFPLEKREERLAWALTDLSYHYILLDCPPNLTLGNVTALYAADAVLITVQAQDKAVEQVPTILKNIREVQNYRRRDWERVRGRTPRGVPPPPDQPMIIGYALTMVDRRTDQSKAAIADLRATYGGLVFDTMIPMRAALQADSRYRAPIGVYAPTSEAAVAYTALAQEVMTRAFAAQTGTAG